ncbi:xanthine dehydrogenase family protein molybdopterin-binding subunit [Nakamurella endophytica]|uniref:Xanthine dehydrogenase n=1 Tax=Nakamurella endophytica TaxID=1748367 RepID=A0A917SXS1_9ACTN|nr:xanthine dehydrogenase family protein molybdopterin-binding subunit [Nakamurella endophytica]GGM03000.1 xanthine dehydrogenase [Nakamurella endophytica]
MTGTVAAPSTEQTAEQTGGRTSAPAHRVEGREKVTGRAHYAYEYPVDEVAYAWAVCADVPHGRVRHVDVDAAMGLPGVLAVLWHGNAPRMASTGDAMQDQLQSDRVHFRGEVVAVVVATTAEQAREVAGLVRVDYATEPHRSVLTEDDPSLYRPEQLNAGIPTTSEMGDPDAAFERSEVRVDEVYRTPGLHNNAMEPHATTAVWTDDRVTLWDSNQGSTPVRDAVCQVFELPRDRVRVVSTHVGGGFGSKGTPRPQVVLAVLAARHVGRPVRMALTRQQMFALVGYRTPTIQRVRLGADRTGRLQVIDHRAVVQTATHQEFAEQVGVATRVMYAARHRRTDHHVAVLDVPIPSWMRAPGECPGMYALESAMDELAVRLGMDPVELRIRNEPATDPERGTPFSSRNLVACLRRGADLVGWADRDPRPRSRREGEWWIGTGVASSTYPAYASPASASATAHPDGGYTVRVNATDIGTGARTALLVLAAEALGAARDRVRILIGDSDLPEAGVAGGSMGTASWGWAVTKVCAALRAELEDRFPDGPAEDLTVQASTEEDLQDRADVTRQAFGAQFATVRVSDVTGEIRLDRMVGVFAAGRIVNPVTARSQFLGGMTMGVGMALLEEGVMDAAFGDYANHDLATYHVPVNADIRDIHVEWIDEHDEQVNPMGTKGIGEIGIVGAAAAVANAVHHATGIRVRSLPVHLEDVASWAR